MGMSIVLGRNNRSYQSIRQAMELSYMSEMIFFPIKPNDGKKKLKKNERK